MRNLALVAVAALSLRLFVLSVSGTIPLGDSWNYHLMVQAILNGQGLVFDDPWLGPMRAQYPPLLPVLLSMFALIGGNNPATYLCFNFACDLGTAAGIVWLGRLIGTGRSEWAAAAYLLWPANIILSPLAQKEPLVAMLAVLVICALVERRPIIIGLFSGLLALAQPGLAPLPLVAGLILRVPLKQLAIGGLVAASVMVPWWVRNWLLFGEFIPFTTGAGLALWIGAAPWGNGTWIPLSRHLIEGGELAMGRAAAAEAWGWISANPIDYLAHSAAKVFRAFKIDTWPAYSLWLRAPHLSLIGDITAFLSSLLYGLAAAAAIWNKPPIIGRAILACLIELLLFQFWFEFAERHRYFLVPFLMLALWSRSRRTSPSSQLSSCRLPRTSHIGTQHR